MPCSRFRYFKITIRRGLLTMDASKDLLNFVGEQRFSTILADPPWQFQNRTGKMAPEHKRLNRYSTMKLDEIKALPVSSVAEERAHLYLWVPNALLPDGLEVLKSWGPFLELFGRGNRSGWTTWGNQADEYTPTWTTYKNHSQAHLEPSNELLLLEKKAQYLTKADKK